LLFFNPARVAKLVDAPGLGPDGSNTVGVRVPPRAPKNVPSPALISLEMEKTHDREC